MNNFLLRCRSSHGLEEEQRHAKGEREEGKHHRLSQSAPEMSIEFGTNHFSRSEGYLKWTARRREDAMDVEVSVEEVTEREE